MGLRQELVCCVSRHTAHPHAHNTCAPVSRCLRSLAYEPLAVPHRIVGKNPVIPDALRAIRDLETQPSAIYKRKNSVVPDALRAIRDLDTQPSAIYKHYFRRPALDPGPRHETVIPD